MQITEKHIQDIPEQVDCDATRHVVEAYDTAGGGLVSWANDRLQTATLGDQRFQYIYDRPDDWSGATVVAPAEYANGIHAGLILRSLVVRQGVDPSAALIIAPNQTIHSLGQNFSREERKHLANGDISPAVDRVRIIVDEQHGDEELVLYGPSQSAAILSAYASHPDTTSRAALAVVEPPHIQARGKTRLAKDFLTSGSRLADNITSNFDSFEEPIDVKDEIIKGIGMKDMALYGLGALLAQNRAFAGIMRIDTARNDIARALEKGVPVVHAWGEHGTLSGDEQNSEIAESIISSPIYAPIRMLGEDADHSITNRYALNARLVRMSLDMLRGQ